MTHFYGGHGVLNCTHRALFAFCSFENPIAERRFGREQVHQSRCRGTEIALCREISIYPIRQAFKTSGNSMQEKAMKVILSNNP